MSSRPYSKGKRVITACWECHRRKQKCNRAKPCNVCITRKVPDKCLYGDITPIAAQTVVKDRNISTSDIGQEQDHLDSSSSTASSIQDQIGYSSKNEQNSFIALQKSLLNDHQTITAATSSSKTLLHTCSTERFRHLTSQLPSGSITSELVAVYFCEANWWYMSLEKHYFYKLLTLWNDEGVAATTHGNLQHLSRELQYFPALLFQVLAVAAQLLPSDGSIARALKLKSLVDCDALSQGYSKIGLEIMALLGRHKPAISSVEHDIMRAIWLKNCSQGMESWHSVGNAIRQAQELSLHLESEIVQGPGDDVEHTLERLWQEEYRRRLWARLFVLDSHMALILGRPRIINRSDCTAKPPLDCEIPDNPTRTVPIPHGKHQAPSMITTLIFHYKIGHKIHDLLSSGAGKPHVNDYNEVRALHDQVVSLINLLPPAMRPEYPDISWDSRNPELPKMRQHAACISNSFLMGLHRPHVAVHPPSRQAAMRAALGTLEAQQRLFELIGEHQYRIYGFSFYTIDAGVFLAAIVIEQPVKDHDLLKQVYDALQKAIARLALMKVRSAVAISGEQILSQCFLKIQQAVRMHPDAFDHLNHIQRRPEPVRLAQFAAQQLVLEAHNSGYQYLSNLLDVGRESTGQIEPSMGSEILSHWPDYNDAILLNPTDEFSSFGIDQLSNDISWDTLLD